jgi:hypothetical protein
MRSQDDELTDNLVGADGDPIDWPESGLSRRTLLRTAGAVSVALPAVLGQEVQAAVRSGGFFNAADLALVDELSEMIIPADAHSPGGRAAGVAREIDRRLAELHGADPLTPPRRRLWREGLRQLDRLARAAGGKSFMAATAEQRLAVLTQAARNELAPKTTEELFFVELKREVSRAYYTSEIGIAKDLEYKGNTYLQEFVGHDAASVPIAKIRKGP